MNALGKLCARVRTVLLYNTPTMQTWSSSSKLRTARYYYCLKNFFKQAYEKLYKAKRGKEQKKAQAK